MSSNWDDPNEMLLRGQTARKQGDMELAYQMFARASELNPQDAQAWQGRAETATSADEALVSYGYAYALDEKNQPLARTLDATIARRTAGALQEDVGLLVAMGQELAEVGLTDRAQTLFQRAAELDSSSTDAWVWLAGTSTDSATQVEYLNRALETNPRDSRARAGLVALKPPTVPDSTAPTVAAPSETQFSNPPPPATSTAPTDDLNALLAQASLTQDPQAKIELYQRALQLDPDNVQARDGLFAARASQLDNSARTPDSASIAQTSRQSSAAAPSDNRMRTIFIILVALVVILALAGILLLLTQ